MPTYPGHWPGASRAGITHDDYVRSVTEFIENRELRDVILVGHSFGGSAPRTYRPVQGAPGAGRGRGRRGAGTGRAGLGGTRPGDVTSRRYALEFTPKALRALRKLDRPVVERIKAATDALREDPRPSGARMLTGMHGVLPIRVAGDYRVLYTVDDDRLVVLVVDAGHRRQIYR